MENDNLKDNLECKLLNLNDELSSTKDSRDSWRFVAIIFMIASFVFGIYIQINMKFESKEPFLKPEEMRISKDDTTYIYRNNL